MWTQTKLMELAVVIATARIQSASLVLIPFLFAIRNKYNFHAVFDFIAHGIHAHAHQSHTLRNHFALRVAMSRYNRVSAIPGFEPRYVPQFFKCFGSWF